MLELSLAEQVAELKEQLRKANERRATADRAAEEMQTTVTELREQIVKRGEEQKTLTDEAGKEVKTIKKLNSKACWSNFTKWIRLVNQPDGGLTHPKVNQADQPYWNANPPVG